MAQKKKGSGASRKSKKTASKSSRKKAAAKSGKKPARKKAPGKKKASGKRKAPGKKKAASRKVSSGKAGRGTSTPRPARKAGGKKAAARRTPARTPKSAKGASKRAPGRDAAFFDHFRQKLLDQRQQITRRLDELREELRGLESTPRELEEWAQEEKDRDILIRLEDRETEELRKIQAALGLIDRKEYGYCQNCGKPIPRARLEELPTAFRCVDCTS
ncbi:MAG TPA: TraR/DksA C4-type zinc finger protein [Gemmatimonadota bacterium]|nr:TraR/DksA C4-type zinc finger protein [Gemmatimonadota bacterium]